MILRTLFVVSLLVLLANCGKPNGAGQAGGGADGSAGGIVPPGELPPQAATINGTITQVQPTSILVAEQPGTQAGGRKIVFSITSETRMFAGDGEQLRPIAASDLAIGQRVEAWAIGAIAESYPEQATAGTIVVAAGEPHQGAAGSEQTSAAPDVLTLPNKRKYVAAADLSACHGFAVWHVQMTGVGRYGLQVMVCLQRCRKFFVPVVKVCDI